MVLPRSSSGCRMLKEVLLLRGSWVVCWRLDFAISELTSRRTYVIFFFSYLSLLQFVRIIIIIDSYGFLAAYMNVAGVLLLTPVLLNAVLHAFSLLIF